MKVTVLLTTFNNGKYIYEAVKSILMQSYTSFEFLIIDDCSQDNTVKIIKSFKDPRIKLIKNDYNLGLGDRLNQGLRLSNNDIIARMDGDDIAFPHRLFKQFRYLEKNKHIDVLSCQYAVLIGKNIRYLVKPCTQHEEIRKKLVLHSDILHPGVIYNKNTILKYGGYKNIPIEDFELWLRIKDKVVFGNVPEVLILKRYHNNAISQQLEIKNTAAYNYLSGYYTNLNKEFNVSDINLYKGWREYFYGDKNKARYYFKRIHLKSLNYKIIFASLVTLLSNKLFSAVKELRLRYLFKYWFTYYNKENRALRKSKEELHKLIGH